MSKEPWAALEILQEYDNPMEYSEGPMSHVEPGEFLQEEGPSEEPE